MPVSAPEGEEKRERERQRDLGYSTRSITLMLTYPVTRYMDPTSTRIRNSQKLHFHPDPSHGRNNSQSGQSLARMGMGYRKTTAEGTHSRKRQIIKTTKNSSSYDNTPFIRPNRTPPIYKNHRRRWGTGNLFITIIIPQTLVNSHKGTKTTPLPTWLPLAKCKKTMYIHTILPLAPSSKRHTM